MTRGRGPFSAPSYLKFPVNSSEEPNTETLYIIHERRHLNA